MCVSVISGEGLMEMELLERGVWYTARVMFRFRLVVWVFDCVV